jgi:hypothetical protein
VLHSHVSTICNLSQVIRDFYRVKIGPEVVLATRWRPEAKMTSLFDSPTPIMYRLSVEIFRHVSYHSKVIHVCLFGIPKIWGFWGILTSKYYFLLTRPPKGTSLQQTASFESSCVQIGSAVLAVDDEKKNR